MYDKSYMIYAIWCMIYDIWYIIGGWGCGAGFSPTPEPGNRFRLRLRLRCVRACERAKLRARDDSPVAGARRANLWVVVRPSSSSGRPSRWKVRAVRPLTDDSCSFGGGECFPMVVSSSRWCFVRVSWVPCWIVVLDPPASTVAVLIFSACFACVSWVPG